MTLVRVAWRDWPLAFRVAVVAGTIAVITAMLLLDPLGPATIDPDAASSVLYFQRIVGGQRLEAFVPTTPKPLLTLVYGITWSVLHDWRALVWETIAAWGIAVGATAALVGLLADRVITRVAPRRSASGDVAPVISRGTPELQSTSATLAAGAFATAALLASSDLLLEVSRANSLIWALAGWSIAGVAILLVPARPRVAGVALLLAGMCRFETLALAAVALLAAILVARRGQGEEARFVVGIAETGDQLRARTVEAGRRRRVGLLVGVGLAVGALPVALLHDWLLSGDPLYWLSVPSRYTAIFNPSLASVSPIAFAGAIAARLAPEWLLLVLAAIGVVVLLRARLWLPLAGIAAIGLGVIALLFWLAVRATYISNRYYEPIDLALVVAAAVGVGWIAWRLAADVATAVPVAGVAAVVLGGLATWPALPWDRRATTELSDVRTASGHLAAVQADLRRQLALVGSDGRLETTELLIPSRDVARFSVESGVSLKTVRNSYALLLNQGVDGLQTGQIVFHDSAADRPVALYRPLEIDDQGPVGGHILVRLDPRAPGIWVLSVR